MNIFRKKKKMAEDTGGIAVAMVVEADAEVNRPATDEKETP